MSKYSLQMLASVRIELEEIQRERHLFRIQESERLRVEHERLLGIKMEEVYLAFNNAETDKVKGLKLKPTREKSKRKKAEEQKHRVFKVTHKL